MRKLTLVVVLLLSAMTLQVGQGTATAGADTTRAAGTFRLTIATNRVDQGQTISITAETKGLGKGKVYLQRTAGTGKAFTTVGKVKKNGQSLVVGAPMGKYKYRLALVRGGKTVAYSNKQKLFSYGPVTFEQYCDRTEDASFDSCSSGTIPVGSNVFAYTNYSYSNSGPDEDAAVIARKSSCRSATIEYAASNSAADDGVTVVGVALSQEAADRQLATTPARTVGAVTFAIGSQAWNLNFWTEGDSYYIYYRGTLSCYTTNGDA